MWIRLCVDVEHNGNPRGWSWEQRSETGPIRIHVGPQPGPFDTAEECLAAARKSVLDVLGEQVSLFD